ncbi:hypothetical protein HUU42_15850 [bacterium]|nr:hypothetical protein [bacterium]
MGKYVRIRLGGFLMIVPLPQLNDEQQKLSLAILVSFLLNAVIILFLIFFTPESVVHTTFSDTQKIITLNLEEDEAIKKAKELLANPLANRQMPDDAKILSDVESKGLKEIPDEMKNSQTIAVAPSGGIEEQSKINNMDESKTKEDEFDITKNVRPFLKTGDKPSVMDYITGNKSSNIEKNTGVGQLYELSTYRWNFAPYMLKWKDKMTGKWYEITSRINFYQYANLGKILIYVKMDRHGKLLDSKVLEYDCDKSFVAPAYASVINSFPLDPLPETFPDEFLETTWTITITN